MKDPLSKRLYAGLLILLLSVVASAASARPDFDADGMHERMFDRISKKLQLTDEQLSEVQQLREQFKVEHKDLHEQMRSTHSALKEQTRAEVFDESAVEALANDLGSLKAESVVARAKHDHQFQQILNAEQREKWASWKEKRGEHMGRRAHKRNERRHKRAHDE